MGTWIEIHCAAKETERTRVVPYVGTWIEILTSYGYVMKTVCRSLRGNVDRNAKIFHNDRKHRWVVPYVGTWIEICQ